MSEPQAHENADMVAGVGFSIHLDTFFPAPEQSITQRSDQHALPVEIDWRCEHHAPTDARPNGLQMHGVVQVSPSAKAHFSGLLSDVEIVYRLAGLRPSAAYDELFGSDLWRFASTRSFEVVLNDLNRVVDLYRLGGFPNYLMQGLSTFNFISLQVFLQAPDGKRTVICTAFPKTFGGVAPVDAAQIAAGVNVPFYYRLYLDGRRHFAEGRFQEAQVAVGNAVEAASKYLMDEINRRVPGAVAETLDDYRSRYGQANRALFRLGFAMKGRKSTDLVKVAMRYRNAAMHGEDFAMGVADANEMMDAVKGIADYVHDAAVFCRRIPS